MTRGAYPYSWPGPPDPFNRSLTQVVPSEHSQKPRKFRKKLDFAAARSVHQRAEMSTGMSRGRRWLGGLLCVVPATLLGACGETSQPPGGASLDRAGNGAGGALNGGSSGSGG